ncbi:MAG: hypothetical protein O2954_12300, partial [bacterium]|nr:hypothetical protein [bacterium]
KSAEDLSAREPFELLSARQIRNAEQVVNILSSLQDKLARDRAEQARKKAASKKSGGSAMLEPIQKTAEPDVADLAAAVPAFIKYHTFVTRLEARGSPPTPPPSSA